MKKVFLAVVVVALAAASALAVDAVTLNELVDAGKAQDLDENFTLIRPGGARVMFDGELISAFAYRYKGKIYAQNLPATHKTTLPVELAVVARDGNNVKDECRRRLADYLAGGRTAESPELPTPSSDNRYQNDQAQPTSKQTESAPATQKDGDGLSKGTAFTWSQILAKAKDLGDGRVVWNAPVKNQNYFLKFTGRQVQFAEWWFAGGDATQSKTYRNTDNEFFIQATAVTLTPRKPGQSPATGDLPAPASTSADQPKDKSTVATPVVSSHDQDDAWAKLRAEVQARDNAPLPETKDVSGHAADVSSKTPEPTSIQPEPIPIAPADNYVEISGIKIKVLADGTWLMEHMSQIPALGPVDKLSLANGAAGNAAADRKLKFVGNWFLGMDVDPARHGKGRLSRNEIINLSANERFTIWALDGMTIDFSSSAQTPSAPAAAAPVTLPTAKVDIQVIGHKSRLEPYGTLTAVKNGGWQFNARQRVTINLLTAKKGTKGRVNVVHRDGPNVKPGQSFTLENGGQCCFYFY